MLFANSQANDSLIRIDDFAFNTQASDGVYGLSDSVSQIVQLLVVIFEYLSKKIPEAE